MSNRYVVTGGQIIQHEAELSKEFWNSARNAMVVSCQEGKKRKYRVGGKEDCIDSELWVGSTMLRQSGGCLMDIEEVAFEPAMMNQTRAQSMLH